VIDGSGQHIHKLLCKSILCLFVKRCLCSHWVFGIGSLLVGFGGVGICRQSSGGAGVIIVLVVCVLVVQSGKLLVIKGVLWLLVVWFGRKFGEFIFILAGWVMVGNAAGKFGGIVIGGGGDLNAIRATGDFIFSVGPEGQILGKIAGKERFEAAVNPSTCILKVGLW